MEPLQALQKSVGIVGCGPAGMATAKTLLRKTKDISVDMFDKKELSGGMIRYGVAPDHEDRYKSFIRAFDEFAKTNKDRLGVFHRREIEKEALSEMRRKYSAVVLCTGAQKQKALDIPTPNTPLIWPAAKVVGWYKNQHKESPPLPAASHVAVIGGGNVALDIARMLLKSPKDLVNVSPEVGAALKESAVSKITIFRRAPRPETNQALKELRDLPDTLIAENSRVIKQPPNNRKTLQIETPVKIEKIREESGKIILSVRNTETQTTKDITCDFLIVSTGYELGSPFPLSFSDNHFLHDGFGRVAGEKNLYAAGWCKTGPRGSLPHTLADATQTANTILSDMKQSP
ncbi:MAG: ferrodoxin-NADP(+) reductase [Amphiamblys sp. WSBS2006]|nr:MAG: ferrodoxin-NADP(+) reductase [Amphiamblys sp. WSBS2006]